MQTVLPYAMLVVGFVLLVKGADLLVTGAVNLAQRLRISDLMIAMTIVAFGTSSPELVINIVAGFKGSTDIAIGNVLGSNTANILLVLGVSALIYPLSVSSGTVQREIPFSLLAALAMGVLANDQIIDGRSHSILSRSDGLIFLMFLVIFLYYSTSMSADNLSPERTTLQEPSTSAARAAGLAAAGLVGLALGGKWIVEGAVDIAGQMGLSEALVGLTIVAIGTSLPELATSAVAAYRRRVDIAIGNVVGSNILNIFLVLGVSATLRPMPFHTAANVDIGMVVLASLILFFAMLTGRRRRLDRWEGGLLLVTYAVYLVFLIIRG